MYSCKVLLKITNIFFLTVCIFISLCLCRFNGRIDRCINQFTLPIKLDIFFMMK